MPWLGEGWQSLLTEEVEPPPSLPWTPSVPNVTNFNSTSEVRWTGIDGFEWSNHNANRPSAPNAYALTNPDSQTVRFEIRAGDQWQWDIDNGTDSGHNEMQLIDETPVGNNFFVQYEFMMEPGPLITSWFYVFDQIQTLPGGTPPFYIGLEDNKHVVRVATNQSNWIYPFRDTVNINRGHWYQMEALVNFTNGVCDVWRDGILVCNYRGPFGYGAGGGGAYQIGIYRNNVPETSAVNYRNMKITPG